ncbi:hypothetical protein [Kutzneria kofuensis]|uniref:Uncharacterized protein n=1 Tax=Kutzneria kofuensis TaxID=103725 RepID=A0A7W9KIQ6_9PSEU|nr:hypothetical protein [Kutzneria kofuensis]MBB5893325.1 hypothetical protein [Kutzneria kofuensis]
MEDDEATVHNEVTGSVSGNVIQGRDMEVHIHAGPEPARPTVSEYLRSLARAIDKGVRAAGGKPLVVTGPDAVKAVRFWAGRAGGNYYRGRTAVIDLAKPAWRDDAKLAPHHILALLLNARTLDEVREFRRMRTWPGEILIVVAAPQELAETDGVRVLRTSEVQARTATFDLLPSELRYSLHPAKIAFPIAVVATLIVVNVSQPLPGFVVVILAVLTAVVSALGGYGVGHVVRGFFPPGGGQLVVSPDGVDLRTTTGFTRLSWSDIEFVAMVPRAGAWALLVKVTSAEEVVDLCLVGVGGLHCDRPALKSSRDDVLRAVKLYWPGPVVDTRAGLLAQDKQLGDRFWPGPRSADT